MKIFLMLVALLMLFSCNEKEKTEEKNPTRAECESIQDESECKKAGCLYSCGISLWNDWDNVCLARKRAGICVAPSFRLNGFNNTNYWLIQPRTTIWVCRRLASLDPVAPAHECFQITNTRSFPIGIYGIDEVFDDAFKDDPCLKDPNEADFPFEGSCEELWWSRTLWEDILGAYRAVYDNW